MYELAKRVKVLVLPESFSVWFEADRVNIDHATNDHAERRREDILG